MRSPNIIFSLTLAALSLASCGGSVTDTSTGGSGTSTSTGTGGTGATTSSTSSTSSSTTSSSTTSSSTTSSSTCPNGCCGDCCLDPNVCKAVDLECVALVDNAGNPKPGLRMAQLSASAPPALSSGLVAGVVASAVSLADPNCNLTGSATFSWLLQFDLATAKLRTGGALPVADPSMGFAFLTQSLGGVSVAPVDLDTPVQADGSFSTATGVDINMPIFLDAAGTQYVILPVRQLRVSGKLSPSHSCIGRYNAEGLSPDNLCLPFGADQTFVTGGTVNALITLEDADKIMIAALNESLCVLLANNMGVQGPNGKVCERDANNKIVFQGDACSTGTGCGDAVTFAADFAASAVKIN